MVMVITRTLQAAMSHWYPFAYAAFLLIVSTSLCKGRLPLPYRRWVHGLSAVVRLPLRLQHLLGHAFILFLADGGQVFPVGALAEASYRNTGRDTSSQIRAARVLEYSTAAIENLRR